MSSVLFTFAKAVFNLLCILYCKAVLITLKIACGANFAIFYTRSEYCLTGIFLQSVTADVTARMEWFASCRYPSRRFPTDATHGKSRLNETGWAWAMGRPGRRRDTKLRRPGPKNTGVFVSRTVSRNIEVTKHSNNPCELTNTSASHKTRTPTRYKRTGHCHCAAALTASATGWRRQARRAELNLKVQPSAACLTVDVKNFSGKARPPQKPLGRRANFPGPARRM